MPRMSDADYQLSMLISPRARDQQHNDGLREVHVHRLSNTTKAVARAALRRDAISVVCEGCSIEGRKKWTSGLDEFPEEWDCPNCKRSYRAELVVYEEVEADDDQSETSRRPPDVS